MAKGKKVEGVQDETQATQGGGSGNAEVERGGTQGETEQAAGLRPTDPLAGGLPRAPEGGSNGTGNGPAATGRKRGGKSRGQSPDRKYWIVGQRHLAAPQQFLLPLGTVGQARKRLEEFRSMPQYDGWILSVWRCHRVT